MSNAGKGGFSWKIQHQGWISQRTSDYRAFWTLVLLQRAVGALMELQLSPCRLALNLLRRDKTCRVGIKGKRLQACLKEDYLLRILAQGI